MAPGSLVVQQTMAKNQNQLLEHYPPTAVNTKKISFENYLWTRPSVDMHSGKLGINCGQGYL